MRKLAQDNQTPQWDKRLVADLAFIRQHLRYPFSSRVMVPRLLIGIVIGLGLRLTFVFTELHKKNGNNWLLPFFIIFIVLIPLIVSINRYYQSLKFVSISTHFVLVDNINLLQRFLFAQRLVISRHPEAPDVFQIMSHSVSASRDEREVMIFIADDKRILINSHFTNTGFSLSPASRNCKQMAAMLREYIHSNIPIPGTGLTPMYQ